MNMRYQILMLSPYGFYSSVGAAGEQTKMYYYRQFLSDPDFEIKAVAFINEKDQSRVDLKQYGADYDFYVEKNGVAYKFYRNLFKFHIRLNPLHRAWGYYDGFKKHIVVKKLKKLKETGYRPDVIICENTEFCLFIDEVKNIFGDVVCVASEADVSFLKQSRIYENTKNALLRKINAFRYRRFKALELKKLKRFHFTVTYNEKDKRLLTANGIKADAIETIAPFFTDYLHVEPDYSGNNVLFYGAMGRYENYESAIWLIKNVFLHLNEKYDAKLYIVGANPHPKLLKYQSKNIIITGFVDDPGTYFEKCCLTAVPLLMGAGIKVKIIEAMSAYLPVVTNHIGIEGIPVPNDAYLHAETPGDFIGNIEYLLDNPDECRRIGDTAAQAVHDNFNMEESYRRYKERTMAELKRSPIKKKRRL